MKENQLTKVLIGVPVFFILCAVLVYIVVADPLNPPLVVAKPTAAAVPAAPVDKSRPYVGMTYADFGQACGDPENIRVTETETVDHVYVDNFKRAITACNGRFYFRGTQLVTISR